jgi:hypothetical protein
MLTTTPGSGSGRELFPVYRISYYCIMDKNAETPGNSRDLRASQIRSFLTEALAGGEETVVALQERARAAGLLRGRWAPP